MDVHFYFEFFTENGMATFDSFDTFPLSFARITYNNVAIDANLSIKGSSRERELHLHSASYVTSLRLRNFFFCRQPRYRERCYSTKRSVKEAYPARTKEKDLVGILFKLTVTTTDDDVEL